MSRLLRKKQDKKLTHHTFLYKKTSVPIRAHPCPSVGVKNFVQISEYSWTKTQNNANYRTLNLF